MGFKLKFYVNLSATDESLSVFYCMIQLPKYALITQFRLVKNS